MENHTAMNLTSYPIEAPMDDVMTYSMSFQGKYEKVDSGGGETPQVPEVIGTAKIGESRS